MGINILKRAKVTGGKNIKLMQTIKKEEKQAMPVKTRMFRCS